MILSVLLMFFFFFKQKTAYEMRISDWSSDVCSADQGAFDPVTGTALRFDYWRLSGGREKPGEARSALKEKKGDWIEPEAFAAFCAAEFADAAEKYLTGTQPFVAKLHPQDRKSTSLNSSH